MSQAAGLERVGGSFLANAIGQCPEAIIGLGSESVRCLLDTGAEVSCITSSYFCSKLDRKYDVLDVSSYLSITAANGQPIPYKGYVEIDLTVLGQTIPRVGFLILNDVEEGPMAEKRESVPVILGSNVFRAINQHLGVNNNPSFLTELAQSTEGHQWTPILALYASPTPASNNQAKVDHILGAVRLAGHNIIRVPAMSKRIVACTTRQNWSTGSPTALVTGLLPETGAVPRNVFVKPSMVNAEKGIIPVEMANFSQEDVFLRPHSQVAVLTSGVVLKTIQENPLLRYKDVLVGTKGPSAPTCQNEPTSDSVRQLYSKLDIGSLETEQQLQVEAWLQKHFHLFSQGDHDLGYCDVVKHKITTTDDNPVKVPYRRVNPHFWPQVEEYLETQLSSGVLRPSKSPWGSAMVLVKKPCGSIRVVGDFKTFECQNGQGCTPPPAGRRSPRSPFRS